MQRFGVLNSMHFIFVLVDKKWFLERYLLQRQSVIATVAYFDLVSMMDDILVAGVTPAEKLLELYNGKWGQSVDPVFEELLY
jgi:gamma-glutamylcysteine synthetase